MRYPQRRRSPGRGARRRVVWADTFIGAQSVAAAGTYQKNLMSDIDAELGIFVNKGYSVRRILVDCLAAPTAASVNGGIGEWGIVAADPNIPVANLNLNDSSLRKIAHGAFLIPPTLALNAGSTVTIPPQHYDSRVRYTFPDAREDLWMVFNNNLAGAMSFQFRARILLAMP